MLKAVLSKSCNSEKYGAAFGDASARCVNYVADNTARHGFNLYHNETDRSFPFSRTRDTTYYCHGACNGELSQEGCTECMRETVYKIQEDPGCRSSIGVPIELPMCRIRYENYRFQDD